MITLPGEVKDEHATMLQSGEGVREIETEVENFVVHTRLKTSPYNSLRICNFILKCSWFDFVNFLKQILFPDFVSLQVSQAQMFTVKKNWGEFFNP